MIGQPPGPTDPTSMLSAERRLRELEALAAGKQVDLLVIGGGVTGAGVALDAASRGLTVALIDKDDLAFGTSRWSSKLVHGGLRYLASGRVGVAWESAVERARIMSFIAPHLTRPMPQLIPIMSDTRSMDRRLNSIGFRAGDVLRRVSRLSGRILPAPRFISADRAHRLAPSLDRSRLRGALIGWDGQLEDDARLVIAIARTAAAYGASIITYCAADQLRPDGATVTDRVSGDAFDIRARNVINATGVWAGDLDPRVTLRPSLGSHAVLRAETLGNPRAAVTVAVPGHFGRFVFALPQPNGLAYVGLTDEPLDGPIPDHPVAPRADLDWILGNLSLALARPVDSSDAVGSYAGVRPLVDMSGGADSPSADISRQHLVLGERGQVVTVTGGKLTTYRRMAQDAVNRITDVPCRTERLPLVGAGRPLRDRAKAYPPRLVRRFGAEAPRVAALAEGRPELLKPLGGNDEVDVLGVELIWGAIAEGALNLADLSERRTRLSLVPGDLDTAREDLEAIAAEVGITR